MDITEHWLKQNDPFYGRKCANRYSYMSNAMMDYRQKREIPVSNVYKNEVREIFDVNALYRG